MFCNKRRTEPYVEPVAPQLVDSAVLITTEFYKPSAVDGFLHVEMETPEDTEKSIRLTSDIYMLFNQQRLDRMSRETLLQHFDALQVKEPSFAAIRSKLTDDQLCTFVKSRFIQSPSELLNWSQYLVTTYGEEYAAALASANSATPPVDSATTADAE